MGGFDKRKWFGNSWKDKKSKYSVIIQKLQKKTGGEFLT